MAKKKAEMEIEYNLYEACMHDAKELSNQGLYAAALKKSMEALEYIDGMMQYARKYKEKEFHSIEAIDNVIKYAPLLFDQNSLDQLEQRLKFCKRIEKNTRINEEDQISEARQIIQMAYRLWNYLEVNPWTRQDQLRKILGEDQEQWRYISETWERMGLIERKKDGASYRLNLQTRMGALTRGKCINCGSIQEAPKGFFLELTPCPNCHQKVYFVIMPS